MKRSLKIVLMTAGLLCAAGVVLSGVAFAVGGFGLQAFSAGDMSQEKRYDLSATDAAGLDKVLLDVQDLPLEVSPSDDDGVHIRYWEDEKDSYTLSLENGELRLIHTREPDYFSWLTDGMFSGLAELGRKVVLELPASYAGALQLGTSNNSIRLESFRQLAACSLKTSNGSIRLTGIAAGSLTAETTNASIAVRDLTADTARLSSTNGTLSAEGVRLTGDLAASTTNSSLILKEVACAGLEASTTNGGLKLIHTAATGRVQAGTTNGGIRIEALSSPDIRLSSTNGSVRGTVAGDVREYAVSSHTTNGESNLPDSAVYDLPNRLDVRTTNASIDVTFIEP